jgi:hypothetical protein
MKNLVLSLYLLSTLTISAQNFDWIKTVGDINHDFGQWVETDSAGNIYVAGQGQGSCNFDTHVITSVDPFWFVAKYDSNGINTWVAEIPFNNGYLFEMRDFKVNAKGETYIVGDVNTNGGLYGILVKVDSAGNLVKQVTPPTTQNIYSIAFDSDGKYYLGGVGYSGSTTVMFVNSYAANDNFNWRIDFPNAIGLYNNLSMRVTADNGLLFSFVYKNTITVTDHSTGSISLNATQGILDADRLIAKYDANGVLLWAKTYDEDMPGRQMTVDTAHNTFYLLAHDANGSDADYLLKFDALGNQQWAKNINYQNAVLGWEPKIRLHDNLLFFIGGGISFAVSNGSWGNYAWKWFDLDGNLAGQFNHPQGFYPLLGDIGFYRSNAYLVGAIPNGTWNNQTITTVHGTNYDDYFLAALSKENFTTNTSVTKLPERFLFVVYPNPVTTELRVAFDNTGGEKEIKIYDITGKTIRKSVVYEISTSINVCNLESGLYFISITAGNHTTTQKFLKK